MKSLNKPWHLEAEEMCFVCELLCRDPGECEAWPIWIVCGSTSTPRGPVYNLCVFLCIRRCAVGGSVAYSTLGT